MRSAVALLLILTALATGVLWLNDQPAQSAGNERALYGSYTVEMNVTFGEGHQPYIQMPHTIKLRLNADPGFPPAFLGPAPFVAVVSGGIDSFFRKRDDSIWEFHMTGHGTVAGYEDVSVEFSGEFDANGTLTGTYSMGKNYELPGGYAILYRVKNATYSTFTPTITNTPWPTDTPTNTPDNCMIAGGSSCTPTNTPGPQETVEQFLQLFNSALQTGDESFLLDRLDPHVIEEYGEADCAATVAAMVDPTSAFTIKSISGPASWKWNPPGVSVLVDDVYTVSVERVVEGTSSVQDIHLAVVQGHLTWFRTCPPAGTPAATTTPDNCLIAGGSNCTPTATPTPQAVPPTATHTPSATPGPGPTLTPTPRHGDGDCDHDGTTNARDALLVLQYTAGLIPHPGACGDTNQDGAINAIDCSLILQYVADFISQLPWH